MPRPTISTGGSSACYVAYWFMNTPTVWIYSAVYNALYMIPAIVIAAAACAALAKPLSKALLE